MTIELTVAFGASIGRLDQAEPPIEVFDRSQEMQEGDG
jgi:hypothetical protein